MTQRVGLFLGPVLFFVVLLFFDLDPGKPIVTRMAAVAILMAAWWITDAIPLFATALLPMILFPLLGIMKGRAAAPIYFNSTIFLFLGGFMIALTMEKWNLHKRMALFIIRVIGGGPFFRVPKHVTVDRSIVEKTYKELGSMSFEERSVLIVFFLTAFLWVFRKKTEPGLFDHTRLVTIDSLSQVDCDDIARNSSWGDALVLSIKNRGV